MNHYVSIKERLLRCRRIDEKTGCWLFTLKSKSRVNGHAKIKINGKKYYIHRVSWEIFVGLSSCQTIRGA